MIYARIFHDYAWWRVAVMHTVIQAIVIITIWCRRKKNPVVVKTTGTLHEWIPYAFSVTAAAVGIRFSLIRAFLPFRSRI